MTPIPQLYRQAAIYDRLFGNTQDAAFYTGLITRNGSDCLEICCGTGRLLLELAAAGLEAHGLDYADAMLDEARKKAADRNLNVHLYSGDMRDFDLGRTFLTMLIIGNSLCHLYTLNDIQRHLACVKKHSRPETKYIINVFTPRLDLLLKTGRYRLMDFIDPEDNQRVEVYEESTYNSATQIKLNRWFYEKGGVMEPGGELPMRMFFPQELDALLTMNGFRIVEKLGGFNGAAYSDGSAQQIVICQLS